MVKDQINSKDNESIPWVLVFALLKQDMPKEKKIEAFADYVLVTYVDDTVLCFHHAYMY